MQSSFPPPATFRAIARNPLNLEATTLDRFKQLGRKPCAPRREDACACGCGRVVTQRNSGYADRESGQVWSKFCRAAWEGFFASKRSS